MKAVIDTNVMLVANNKHDGVSEDCVIECVKKLQAMQKDGVTVIDDGFLILQEYKNKTDLYPPKGVGDVFLKFLLRESGNPKHVEQVALTETTEHCFAEFPDAVSAHNFDPPDRKFAAVAYVHPDKPHILQAADCKWLDWWPDLHNAGVGVEFLCRDDACRFYTKKFPTRPAPILPAPKV